MKIQEDGKEERKSKFDQVTNSVLAVVQEQSKKLLQRWMEKYQARIPANKTDLKLGRLDIQDQKIEQVCKVMWKFRFMYSLEQGQ